LGLRSVVPDRDRCPGTFELRSADITSRAMRQHMHVSGQSRDYAMCDGMRFRPVWLQKPSSEYRNKCMSLWQKALACSIGGSKAELLDHLGAIIAQQHAFTASCISVFSLQHTTASTLAFASFYTMTTTSTAIPHYALGR
jgi:hypothetical protein